MPTPERPPMEIAAMVPGKCQCCNTAYDRGARLRKEGKYWVLIEHPNTEQRRAQRPGLRDQFLMGRRNNA